jgi:phage terminase Nu1 subunit (DNA packaging protein)
MTRAAARDGPQPKLLTRRALAEALGVHISTVSEWEKAGMPCAQRGARGVASLFSLPHVKAWRATAERAQRTDRYLSLEQARTRQAEADAALKAQLLAVRAGELLPTVEVKRVWAAEIAAVRSRLLAAPVAWADRVHQVAIRTSAGGVETILAEMIRDVLTELSRGTHVPGPGDGEAA